MAASSASSSSRGLRWRPRIERSWIVARPSCSSWCSRLRGRPSKASRSAPPPFSRSKRTSTS
eukprot:7330779-Pyramimonas_sp.AAC.1